MSFIAVTYRSLVKGEIQEQKWLKGSYIAKSPPSHKWQIAKSRELELMPSLKAAQQVGECLLWVVQWNRISCVPNVFFCICIVLYTLSFKNFYYLNSKLI